MPNIPKDLKDEIAGHKAVCVEGFDGIGEDFGKGSKGRKVGGG